MGELKIVQDKSAIALQKKLLKAYSPNSLQESNINTLEKAIKSKTPTLGTMIREEGSEFTRSVLLLWIVYLNNEINERPMSENQMKTCAMRIMQKHSNLKLADLILVWNKIIDGELQLYGSLGTNKIVSLLDKHFEDRCNFSAELSQRKHTEFRQGDLDAPRTSSKY